MNSQIKKFLKTSVYKQIDKIIWLRAHKQRLQKALEKIKFVKKPGLILGYILQTNVTRAKTVISIFFCWGDGQIRLHLLGFSHNMFQCYVTILPIT